LDFLTVIIIIVIIIIIIIIVILISNNVDNTPEIIAFKSVIYAYAGGWTRQKTTVQSNVN